MGRPPSMYRRLRFQEQRSRLQLEINAYRQAEFRGDERTMLDRTRVVADAAELLLKSMESAEKHWED